MKCILWPIEFTEEGALTEIVTEALGAVDSIETEQDYVLVVTDGLGLVDIPEADQEQEVVDGAGLTDSAILLEEEAESRFAPLSGYAPDEAIQTEDLSQPLVQHWGVASQPD